MSSSRPAAADRIDSVRAGLDGVEALVERALSGPLWIPRAVVFAWLLAMFFSYPGYARVTPFAERRLRQAYGGVVQRTIAYPLLDYARLYPEQSNPAKRTFRVAVPGVARVTGIGVAGAFWFARLCGYMSLHVAAVLALSILGSRARAFFAVLLLAAGYFGTAAFKDLFGWFDAVSYFLLLAAMAARHPAWRTLALLGAFFTDERSVLVAPLTFWWGRPADEGGSSLRSRVGSTAVAVVVYALLRVTLVAIFDLTTATRGIETQWIRTHLPLWLPAVWAPFEGGWLLVAAAVAARCRSGARSAAMAAALGGWLAAYLASCFLVSDVTRSMSFACIGLFPLLAGLKERVSDRALRTVLVAASVITLLAPNIFLWDHPGDCPTPDPCLDYETSLLFRLLG